MRKNALIAVIVAVMAIIGAAAYQMYSLKTQQRMKRFAAEVQSKALLELITVSDNIKTTVYVPVKKKYDVLGYNIHTAETRVVYHAEGEVIAGFDLKKEPPEIRIETDSNGESLSVVFPEPSIRMHKLDLDKSREEMIDRELFGPDEKDALVQAQKAAQKKIPELARQSGILERAKQNLRREVNRIAEENGVENVRIAFDFKSRSPERP